MVLAAALAVGATLVCPVSAQDQPPADHPPPQDPRPARNTAEDTVEGTAATQAALWALRPLRRPPVPAGAAAHPIDRFIDHRLRTAGLESVGLADRTTVIRRLRLDLTGLPPAPEEVDAFAGSRAEDAYTQLVDRLLQSPEHAERMTQHWLDLARYADSNGYHMDAHRDQWSWRDWVIRAFQVNLPFDRFVTLQLAGDLLPELTIEKLVATGFNRNHMTNVEGGADPDEYATRYVVDRVNTFGTTFLGLTVGCAECHDHKYDPLSQKEYYQLYAFFDDVRENGLDGYHGNAVPSIGVPTPAETAELTQLAAVVQRHQTQLDEMLPALTDAMAKWARELATSAQPAIPAPRIAVDFDSSVRDAVSGAEGSPSGQGRAAFVPGRRGQALNLLGEGRSYALGELADFGADQPITVAAWVDVVGRGGPIAAKVDDGLGERGWSLDVLNRHAHFVLQHHKIRGSLRVRMRATFPAGWHHLAATYDGSGRAAGVTLFVDGEPVETVVEADDLQGTIRNRVPLRIGRWETLLPYSGSIDELRIWSQCLDAAAVRATFVEIPRLLARNRSRTPADDARLLEFFRDFVSPTAAAIRRELAAVQQTIAQRIAELPQCMVMADLPEPRQAHVLIRGNYRRRGAPVEPDVPACLPPLPDGAPKNRLTLARWLFDPNHPLTARVAVNRLWQWTMRRGLVPDGANFGATGEPPTHPDLLDWLAVELRESGWDLRHVLRLIVTSDAYRRSARPSPALAAADPDNRLYGRARRVRLDAETIRDNALAIAGLLDRRVGGPSVKPPQPTGYWADLAFGGGYSGQEWIESDGADRYRRGLYVYWKRSALYPSLQIFDAPDRELCTPARAISTTPLQPLVLMNDPVFVSAAHALADRIRSHGGDDRARLDFAMRLCLGRLPTAAEVVILRNTLDTQRRLAPGEDGERTAWANVATVLLNLDEVLNRN